MEHKAYQHLAFQWNQTVVSGVFSQLLEMLYQSFVGSATDDQSFGDCTPSSAQILNTLSCCTVSGVNILSGKLSLRTLCACMYHFKRIELIERGSPEIYVLKRMFQSVDGNLLATVKLNTTQLLLGGGNQIRTHTVISTTSISFML